MEKLNFEGRKRASFLEEKDHEELAYHCAFVEGQVRQLHALIEQFWIKQCEGSCQCSEKPECVHTINASELRKQAMELERP